MSDKIVASAPMSSFPIFSHVLQCCIALVGQYVVVLLVLDCKAGLKSVLLVNQLNYW